VTKFSDTNGRTWEPSVNVVTIGRVRSALKLNLLELLLPNNTLAERLADPCLMVDVLYLLCEDQAKEHQVSDAAFGASLSMDSIEDGWNGVLEGLVSFSPRGLRPAHQRVLETAKRYHQAAAEKVQAAVATPEFQAMLDREIEKRLNQPRTLPSESTGDAGSLPASSAPILIETAP
jgi:hypothetical protein